jgi:hypothetical protein
MKHISERFCSPHLFPSIKTKYWRTEAFIYFWGNEVWLPEGKSNTKSGSIKAFIVDLPTRFGVDIRIHIGWVDADGS